MESRANYVLVGVFVLAGLVLLGAFVVWLLGTNDHRRYTRYAVTFEESVSGLSEGSLVRFRGIQVGTVAALGLDPSKPEQVRVLIDVDDKLPIRTSTTASMKFQGVTGMSFIELTNGDPKAPDIEKKEDDEYPVIVSTPSSLDKVMNRVPELLDKLSDLTERMNRAFGDDNLNSFAKTLANLEAFSGALVADREALTSLVSDASSAMRGLGGASDRLESLIAGVDKDLIGAVRSLNKVSLEARGILAENRGNVADFSATGLSDLSQLFISAQTAAQHTDTLVDRLSGNPSQIVFPPDSGGYYLP